MLIAYGRHLFFGFCEWQEIMQMKGLEIICVSTNKPGNTPSVFIPSDTFWHQNKLSDVFIFILLLVNTDHSMKSYEVKVVIMSVACFAVNLQNTVSAEVARLFHL